MVLGASWRLFKTPKTYTRVCQAPVQRKTLCHLENGYSHVAVSKEDMDTETIARLTGIAQIKATNADAAIVSLPGFRGFTKLKDRDGYNSMENNKGCAGKLFAGLEIGTEEINMIRQSGKTLCTITMTGKEINDLVKIGLKLYEDQTENFRYVLTVKDDAKLKDDASYVVVLPSER